MKVLMWMGGNFDRRTPSEHLLVAIVEALYKKGNTVHIIQKDTGGDLPKLPAALKKLGVTTDCVPCKLAAKGNFVARYLVDVKYVFECKKYIKQHKDCEAVFNQSSNVAGFMTYIIKKLLPKVHLTYNIQDVFPENAAYIGSVKGFAYKVLSAEQRYAYKRVDQIVTISEDMKDLLVEKGVSAEKIEVIYNWSYSDKLYQKESVYSEKIAKFLPADKFNVVYAGNIGTMQNVDIIVETAKIMQGEKDVHFHIFGDGVYKEKLQRKAEGLENISFWPMQPSELAPSIYSMADVNVIPLAKNIYRTALPSKTATCIACQQPIIFCFGEKSKFLRSIINNGNYFECLDQYEIKSKILQIKQNKNLPHKLNDFSMFGKTDNSDHYADLITRRTVDENCSCM